MPIKTTHYLSNEKKYPILHNYVTNRNLWNIYSVEEIKEGDVLVYEGERYLVMKIDNVRNPGKHRKFPGVKGSVQFYDLITTKKLKSWKYKNGKTWMQE